MAATFNVEGPTEVWLSTLTDDEGSPSWTSLGFTDNADLINFEMENFSHPIKTTRLGEIPEDFVHQGSVGHLNITLIKYDTTEAAKIIYSVPAGAAEGDMGTIGALKLGSHLGASGADNAFAVRLIGLNTYTFLNCVIVGRGIRVLDLGNRPKRLALSILCLPDNLDSATAGPAGTDNIYTVAPT